MKVIRNKSAYPTNNFGSGIKRKRKDPNHKPRKQNIFIFISLWMIIAGMLGSVAYFVASQFID